MGSSQEDSLRGSGATRKGVCAPKASRLLSSAPSQDQSSEGGLPTVVPVILSRVKTPRGLKLTRVHKVFAEPVIDEADTAGKNAVGSSENHATTSGDTCHFRAFDSLDEKLPLDGSFTIEKNGQKDGSVKNEAKGAFGEESALYEDVSTKIDIHEYPEEASYTIVESDTSYKIIGDARPIFSAPSLLSHPMSKTNRGKCIVTKPSSPGKDTQSGQSKSRLDMRAFYKAGKIEQTSPIMSVQKYKAKISEIEKGIQKRLIESGCPREGPDTDRLRIYQKAFGKLIDLVPTYAPLLEEIKSVYDESAAKSDYHRIQLKAKSIKHVESIRNRLHNSARDVRDESKRLNHENEILKASVERYKREISKYQTAHEASERILAMKVNTNSREPGRYSSVVEIHDSECDVKILQNELKSLQKALVNLKQDQKSYYVPQSATKALEKKLQDLQNEHKKLSDLIQERIEEYDELFNRFAKGGPRNEINEMTIRSNVEKQTRRKVMTKFHQNRTVIGSTALSGRKPGFSGIPE